MSSIRDARWNFNYRSEYNGNKLIILPLSLFISLRFNKIQHGDSIVSNFSFISKISITIGVAVSIIALSITRGFEYELNNRILSVIPHGEIESVNQPWKNWNKALEKIEKTLNVIAIPYINFTALVEKGKNLFVIQIKGVDPRQEDRLSTLSRFVQENAWKNFKSGKKQIILGKGIADSLKVKRGDWISLIPYNININHKFQQFNRIRLQIAGILHFSGQFDHKLALVPLEDASKYLDLGSSITGIAIKANDIFTAKYLVRKAGELTNHSVYIKSWIGTYGYMYRDIQMIRTIIYLTMSILMGITCFNIFSTIAGTVKDKIDDIAILRTIGAKNSLIRNIFFWYGLYIGLISSICGIITGVILSLQFNSIIRILEKFIGHHLLSSNIYFIDFLPLKLHWLDVFSVILTTIFFTILASWYPSHYTSYTDPSIILKQ